MVLWFREQRCSSLVMARGVTQLRWRGSRFRWDGESHAGQGREEVFAGLADQKSSLREGVREDECEKLGWKSWWEGDGLEWHCLFDDRGF